MALPATDSFTGNDGDPLSGNWTVAGGTYEIRSNSANARAAGAGSLAGWDSDTFNANQYATGTAAAVSSGYIYTGVAVRVDVTTPAHTGYCYGVSANQSVYLDKAVGGSYTDLALSGEYASVNDVLRIEVDGDSITAKRNGVVQFGGAKTDTAIEAGSSGIHGYGDSSTEGLARLDNWEGGNLGGGAVWRWIDRKLPRGVLRGVA